MIYRGQALDPTLNGRYFFGDFVSGRLFSIRVLLDPDSGEASADDQREHTEALGGEDQLGMISSFGVDHEGEVLVLNYARGHIVRIVPDLATLPRAPFVTTEFDETRLFIAWRPDLEGVAPVSYSLERLQDGVVGDRLAFHTTMAEVVGTPGECVQVRGVARGGLHGPPSARVCFP